MNCKISGYSNVPNQRKSFYDPKQVKENTKFKFMADQNRTKNDANSVVRFLDAAMFQIGKCVFVTQNGRKRCPSFVYWRTQIVIQSLPKISNILTHFGIFWISIWVYCRTQIGVHPKWVEFYPFLGKLRILIWVLQ